MIFAFCLAIGIIALITSFFLYVPNVETSDGKKPGFQLSSFIEPKAIKIAFITLAIAFAYSGVLSFINFYAIEVDLVKAASFFFLIYSAAVLVSRPFTGRLMDLKGANYVMYPAFIFLRQACLCSAWRTAVSHCFWLVRLLGLALETCSPAPRPWPSS